MGRVWRTQEERWRGKKAYGARERTIRAIKKFGKVQLFVINRDWAHYSLVFKNSIKIIEPLVLV